MVVLARADTTQAVAVVEQVATFMGLVIHYLQQVTQ